MTTAIASSLVSITAQIQEAGLILAKEMAALRELSRKEDVTPLKEGMQESVWGLADAVGDATALAVKVEVPKGVHKTLEFWDKMLDEYHRELKRL
jgi:hypothetical protein